MHLCQENPDRFSWTQVYLPGDTGQGLHRCILFRRTRQGYTGVSCQENKTGRYTCVSLSGEQDREDTGVSRQENLIGRTQVYLPGEPDREDTGVSPSLVQDREDTGVSLSGSPDRIHRCPPCQVLQMGGHRCILSGEPDREDTGVSRQENKTGRTQVYLARRT